MEHKGASSLKKAYKGVYIAIGIVWVAIALVAVFYKDIRRSISPPPPSASPAQEEGAQPAPLEPQPPPEAAPPVVQPEIPQPEGPAPKQQPVKIVKKPSKTAEEAPAAEQHEEAATGLLVVEAPRSVFPQPSSEKGGLSSKEIETYIHLRRAESGGSGGANGGTNSKEIETYIHLRRGTVKDCYEEELRRNKDLEGEIELNFTINADGSISSPFVKSYELRFKRVVNCILKRVAEWKFPPTGGDEIEVQVPFRLTTGEFGKVRSD